MPCGCFGKKEKAKSVKGKDPTPPPPPIEVCSPTVDNNSQEDDTGKTKRRDVVASYYEDECALLDYRPTGSRPPSSSYVDSPTSHTHTPSTAPITTSSTSSSQHTLPTASPSNSYSRKQASCRAQLAEKRIEFFRDFFPEISRSSPHYLPTTLPTVARARQFGKVRTSRPLSQPNHYAAPAPPSQPPPGPHLLHPATGSRVSSKLDADASSHEGGFTSPDFLLELKNASEEISRRWAMSEEEKEVLPTTLKMRATNPKLFDPVVYDETEEQTFNYDSEQTPIDSTLDYELSTTCKETWTTDDRSTNPVSPAYSFPVTFQPAQTNSISIQSNALPQTLITPPSPPSAEECLSVPTCNQSDSSQEILSPDSDNDVPLIESGDEEESNIRLNYNILEHNGGVKIEEISEELPTILQSGPLIESDWEVQCNLNYGNPFTQEDERRDNTIEAKGIYGDPTKDEFTRDATTSEPFFEYPVDPPEHPIGSTPLYDHDFDIELEDNFEEIKRVDTSALPPAALDPFSK